MDPTLLLLRWAHLLAAIVAVGGLVFARFGLLPAIADFDEETRDRIHERIRRRWLPWVIGSITLLLASGLANFLLFNARVKEATKELALAFVRSELDGDVSALQAWPQRHTELLARFVAPASIAGFRTS